MMKEQRPVIPFDFFGAGTIWVFELVLDEFKMNGRNDTIRVRFYGSVVHNLYWAE